MKNTVKIFCSNGSFFIKTDNLKDYQPRRTTLDINVFKTAAIVEGVKYVLNNSIPILSINEET